jgi:exo-beta-1,3-glucanase (GH17 family)
MRPALAGLSLGCLFLASACTAQLAGTSLATDEASADDADADDSSSQSDDDDGEVPLDEGDDAAGDDGHEMPVPDSGDGDGEPDGDGSDIDAGSGDDGADADGDDAEPPCAVAGRRCIPAQALARKGLAYSGYRRGQRPGGMLPSEAQIREDLQLITRAGYGFIRLYDSGPHAERVLRVLGQDRLDVAVQLGVWIAGARASHDALNQAEIARAVALAREHAGLVVAVSVGNDALDYFSTVRTPVDDLAAYITQVRDQVEQPVGTDNTYPPFLLGHSDVVDYRGVTRIFEVCDFLAVHVNPFLDARFNVWQWKLESVPEPMRAASMMEGALLYTRDVMRQVQATTRQAGHPLPLLLGEIGWKEHTDRPANLALFEIEPYLAHAVNQKWLVDHLEAWVYGGARDQASPATMFYFSAFDEPWKGADDHWGLFDVDRAAKYALWSRVPELKPQGVEPPDPASAAHFR